MKLVIVDDSVMIRDRIKNQVRLLDDVNIVGEAGNGCQALEVIRDLEPDFVILDLHMKDMGGMEVLKWIRSEGMKTKVCILTNYPYPQYREKCLALGADFFLSKANDFEKLQNVIQSALP